MKQEFEKEHRKAVQNYMDYLAVARSKFEAALDALENRFLSAEVGVAARDMAHKISGNALMYGFPVLGDIAKEFENFLNAGKAPNWAQGQTLCLKLINRIDTIRGRTNMPGHAEFESASLQHDPTPDRWKTGSIETEGYGVKRQMPSVLLIDGETETRDKLADFLANDYMIHAADSAAMAMALAVNLKPDLILTSQQLPDMTGPDMTRFFRQVDGLERIPVVMIMTSDNPQDIVKAVEAGVTDCFEQTSDLQPIVNHIEELLEKTQHSVLIVDDDKAVRDLLKSRFESYGIRVDTASDGIEGLEYLQHEKPDLIVLDRMMPRLEGGAVLYQIQQEVNLKSIPVMLVTAMNNRDDVITWLERGATDYITKPFNPDEVVLRAMRHLRTQRNAA